MMIKASHFARENAFGPTVIPLFNRATDAVFEKTAAPTLLPDVIKYIEDLRPQQGSVYELVNALGACEFFGSNVNADAFSEASLIHRPDDWTGNPILDRITAKNWPYGFPTFYGAHPYMHHRNKDPQRAFGEVEFAAWNDHMKRVELVTRVDKDKCEKFGGTSLWDKLIAGMYVDVSMGTRVKFDLCSICLDWDTYHKAIATFDPKKHRSPDIAALEYHKKIKKIRGLAETRNEYCEDMKKRMNKILPDGRKVFVYNPYPCFFDISFVFIGADKTAKVMMHLTKQAMATIFDFGRSSVSLAESIGYEEQVEKTASAVDDTDAILDRIFKTARVQKKSEMVKDVIPSQFAGKAIPYLNKEEKDLPTDILDTLGKAPLESTLATTAGLGMVLRPREFQRIVLTGMGRAPWADSLDREGVTIPDVPGGSPLSLSSDDFLGSIGKLLLPFFMARSCAMPAINERIIVIRMDKKPEVQEKKAMYSPLLKKIGSMYTDYRMAVPELFAYAQPFLATLTTSREEHHKLASLEVAEFISPLSLSYLKEAFREELG